MGTLTNTRSNATLQAIAKESGMSVMTVSRVLNGKHEAQSAKALERAHKIRHIADEMGYRPNAAAKAMLKGRFSAVGVILSTDEKCNQFNAMRLAGMSHHLAAHQLGLVVRTLNESQFNDKNYVASMLKQLMVDGVVVGLYRGIPQGFAQLIERYRIPVVWINTPQKHECVCPDDLDGARQLTEHLIELGHQRIAFYRPTADVSEAYNHYSLTDRWDGYVQAMQVAGLKPIAIQSKSVIFCRDRSFFLKEQLQDENRPTAMIAYRAGDAASIYRAASMLGLKIPDDLSLIAFLDHPLSFGEALGLTGVALPEFEIGAQAVKILLQTIENPALEIEHQPIKVKMKFVHGSSTARPSVI